MESHMRVVTGLAELLDNRFKIGNFKFGLDPIINFIPGIGGLIGAALSVYIIWIAVEMKLPPDKIAQMFGNVFLDFVIGSIPVVGTFADFIIKANQKNLEILKQYAPADVLEGNVVG